ncbi:MAG: sulfotransferase [Parvularculaceae bacterium]|nr:sulfotransferase [Parvularculaceae bacterium]
MDNPSTEERRTWPIVIGGPHRSGTTLVRRLLNAHSRIFCPSEIKFHKDMLRQFPDDPLAFARLPATMTALELPDDVWLDAFGRAFVTCYELAAAAKGKARWADKNPENVLNIRHWDRLLCGQMIFVFVVRHPLDTLASMAEARMDRALPVDTEGRARHIASYLRAGLDQVARAPRRSVIARFEALVSDPAAALTHLLAGLGEAFEPAMLGAVEGQQQDRIEDPKFSRFGAISNANIGRWRGDLALETLAETVPILQNVMDELAYKAD